MSLRNFLHDIDGSIELDRDFTYPTERVNDRHIMDIVLAGSWSPAEKRMINHVRLFINVITISDLALPCGRLLDAALIQRKPSLLSSYAKHDKTHVDQPPAPAWTAWRKFVKTVSTRLHLVRPLGAWTVPPTKSRRVWPTYLHHHVSPARFWRLDRSTMTYEAYYILPCGILGDRDQFLPAIFDPPGVPVHLEDKPAGLAMSGTHRPVLQPPRIRPRLPATLVALCSSLPSWESDLLAHLNLIADPFSIAQHLLKGACATSDGSVEDDTRGAAAWVLSTLSGERLSACACHAPGTCPSSFRAEGYAVLSLVRFIIRPIGFTRTVGPFPSIVLHTDSKSFRKRLTRHSHHWSRTPNSTIASNYDVVHAVWVSLTECPIHIHLQWIKGHQDDEHPYALLPLPAQLNCDADRTAGNYQRNHGADRGYAHRLVGNPAQLLIRNRTIHTRLRTTIFREYGKRDLLEYTRTRFDWSHDQVSDFSQPILGAALKPIKTNRAAIIKHLFNHSPCARKTHLYGTSESPNCPACQAPVETEEHIVLCPSESRTQWRHDFLQNLEVYLTTEHPCDTTFHHVLYVVTRTYLFSQPFDPSAYPDSAQTAYHRQHSLGLHQLFQGRWSQAWITFYVDAHEPATPYQAQQYLLGLATFFLEQWLSAWHARNGDCHGTTPAEQSQTTRVRLLRELREIYHQRDQMLSDHRVHLRDSYSDHLSDNPSNNSLSNWLSSVRPLVKASVTAATRVALQGVAVLEHYFGLAPDSNAPS